MAKTLWDDPNHPVWQDVSRNNTAFIERLTGRGDATLTVGLYEKGKAPAAAWWTPMDAHMDIDATKVFDPATTRPKDLRDLNLFSRADQEKHPLFIAASFHESSHAKYTHIRPADARRLKATAQEWNVVMSLEEARCESRLLDEYPQYKKYLKSMIFALVAPEVLQDRDYSAMKFAAQSLLILLGGRVINGALPDDDADVVSAMDAVKVALGEDVFETIYELVRECTEEAEDADHIMEIARKILAASQTQDADMSQMSKNGCGSSDAEQDQDDSNEDGQDQGQQSQGQDGDDADGDGEGQGGNGEGDESENGSGNGEGQSGEGEDGEGQGSGSGQDQDGEGQGEQEGSGTGSGNQGDDGENGSASGSGSGSQGDQEAADGSQGGSGSSNTDQGEEGAQNGAGGSQDASGDQGQDGDKKGASAGKEATDEELEQFQDVLDALDKLNQKAHEFATGGDYDGGEDRRARKVKTESKEALERKQAEAEAEAYAQQVAATDPSGVAGHGGSVRGPGTGWGGEGSIRITEKKPDAKTNEYARSIKKAIEKAQFRDIDRTQVDSVLPPGRVRMPEVMRMDRQMARGQRVTAQPWSQTRRRETDNPPINLVVAPDFSGSLSDYQEEIANFSWAFSTAVRNLKGKSTVVAWDSDPVITMEPNKVYKNVRLPFDGGSSSGLPSALLVADKVAGLSDDEGVKFLVILTDDQLHASTFRKTNEYLQQMVRKGVKVLWISIEIEWWGQLYPVADTLDLPKGVERVIFRKGEKFSQVISKPLIDALSDA